MIPFYAIKIATTWTSTTRGQRRSHLRQDMIGLPADTPRLFFGDPHGHSVVVRVTCGFRRIIREMSTEFSEKIATVSGRGSGIGAETAKILAARGASVVLSDIDLESVQKVVDEITQAGGTCTPVCSASSPTRSAAVEHSGHGTRTSWSCGASH
ncbi:hypothetical protein GCM10011374_39230 [Kocuria dechangensis]|uniref:SDR family NAD(P)-dependent oxidoreductase n=1 Tax=Kocuria dechangensis TaxID=1176249 RepID=A0A917M2G4_9MICC|nr:SDR family NAD(P)-dependent oxidoreductase [Kocuria dechangensis]GGG70748.1 hypothetical protein GCM10011374_39230 [Kocuria dechangensis]